MSELDVCNFFLFVEIKSSFFVSAKAGIADFIQPSLGPLQPNLDDFMNGIPFQGKFDFFGLFFVLF